MRLFEITLFVSLGFSLLLPKKARGFSLGLSAALGLLQWFAEGYRWQLLPFYLLLAALIVRGLVEFRAKNHQPPRWLASLASVIGILILIIGVGLSSILPIPKAPEPTGDFVIGTRTLHLTDPSRMDPYAINPDTPRELLVQFWYPAEPAEGAETGPWMANADLVAPAISAWIEMPTFFLDHVIYSTSDSFIDLPVKNSDLGYPIIIFAHGWGGFRAQNTFQMQELASHGYVVASIEFPYASVLTVFPDGRVAQHNPNTLPSGVSESEYQIAARRLVEQWTADIVFVLDTLENLNQSEQPNGFSGLLDLGRLGLLGHSTGGGAALQVCARDNRCDAVMGMDSWMYPLAETTLDSGIQVPWIALFSESWSSPENYALHDRLLSWSLPTTQSYVIDGTRHFDFSDLPALSPLAPALGLKGPLDGGRTLELINTFTLSFFDLFLQNGDSNGPEALLERAPEIGVYTPTN